MTLGGRGRALVAIPLVCILFLALNLLLAALPGRWGWDVTQSGRHTLSEATRTTLKSIREPITLRYYVSPAIRSDRGRRGQQATRVEAMLRRYARIAAGGIRLKVVAPTPYSTAEDHALTDGLEPIRLDRTGRTGFFGLAGFNTTDDHEAIAQFEPSRAGRLEADLTRLVHDLAHPRKPRVGLLGRISLEYTTEDGARAPNKLRQRIEQHMTLEPLDLDTARIPSALDTLILAQPTELGRKTRMAIHDYAKGGGNVLAFVDPLSEALAYRADPKVGARADATVNRLLAPWGVEMRLDRFLADREQALTVRARIGGRPTDIPYVGWIGFGPASLSPQHSMTAQLRTVVMQSAGVLSINAGETTSPLIRGSAATAALPVSKIAGGPDPSALLSDYPPASERQAYPAAVLATPYGSIGGRVVVVADSDMLQDGAWRAADRGAQTADNAGFVLNALAHLTGVDALSGLPGGMAADRPLTRLTALRRKAEREFRARESRLIQTVTKARAALRDLHDTRRQRGTAPTEAERRKAADLRETLAAARRDLREVQHRLHVDVERLQRRVRLANVWGVPLAVLSLALAHALWRRRRLRRLARQWRRAS